MNLKFADKLLLLNGKKFLLTALEFDSYPLVTKERLYLETMEKGLSGVKKFVMDKRRAGKSGLTLFGSRELEGFLSTLREGLSNTGRNQSRGSGMGGGNK